MGRIIASVYEIEKEIGSGGGGIVYLGQHLRLHKKIVLKEDKRSISANPETLRREVDALKNLSHKYIPQVYDFVEENGFVYTVMDYIEGESFEKPLKRGERFSQPQVIEWACQLLEALSYLHQFPPHGILHGDIKPSNIMLTPQNDIRLIDFNIALALGEEGAVAVGRSFGYASPEHYGSEFTPVTEYGAPSLQTEPMTDGPATELMDSEPATEPMVKSGKSIEKPIYSSSKQGKVLDVRSDIYSLGATLYHILTGKRPAARPDAVEPISKDLYSPAVIAIIEKAMQPDPDERFQTAEEMLSAFEHLFQEDARTKRYNRTVKKTIAVLGVAFFVGIGMTFCGLSQRKTQQEVLVLAEYSENALQKGNISGALQYAQKALEKADTLWGNANTAQAQKALTDALDVYDLSDGFKEYGVVSLPSEPQYLAVSPKGKTAAAVCDGELVLFDIATMQELTALPAEKSALTQVRYLNENQILFAGRDGLTAFDLQKKKILWTGKKATAVSVSTDGTKAAAVYKDASVAYLYDTKSGKQLKKIDFNGRKQSVTVNDIFANPEDNLFALNKDASWLGVSFADGSVWLYSLSSDAEDIELYDNTSGLTHFEGGFSGKYFALSASNQKTSEFAVIDTKDLVQTGGFESEIPFGVQADENGIYVQTENILVKLHPVTGEQTPLVTTTENIKRFARTDTYTAISTENGCSFYDTDAKQITCLEGVSQSGLLATAGKFALFGAIDTPEVLITHLEDHKDAEISLYDSEYAHDEARISTDGETTMLFSYDKFRLYRKDGALLMDESIPDAEEVYDQQYCRDKKGCYLEVIYNDGTRRFYSAADGSLMDTVQGDVPDASFKEEFSTEHLRIESPLHGIPIVYDKKSGKQIAKLEKDDYLTYITQVGEYIIAEYVTAEGERYGLLMNEKCETLAYLPGLCDIVGEELVFDYHKGNLRKTRIYHIDELKEMAQKRL